MYLRLVAVKGYIYVLRIICLLCFERVVRVYCCSYHPVLYHHVPVSVNKMRKRYHGKREFLGPRILVVLLVTTLMTFLIDANQNSVHGFVVTTVAVPYVCWNHHHAKPSRPPRLSCRDKITTNQQSSIFSSSPSLAENTNREISKVTAVTSSTTSTPSTASTGISMSDAVFGIIKAMVGSGLLALSSGLAMVTNVPSHLYMAHVLLIGMSVISAYTFILYGKLVHATQAQTLGELWKMIYIDDRSKSTDVTTTTETSSSVRLSDLTVSIATFIFCFGACVAYSLTVGDMFSNFVRGMVGFCRPGLDASTTITSSWLLSNFLQSRQASILLLTGSIVLPLCRLSSLAALAPTSIVGVVGILVTIGFLGYRCPALVPASPYSVSRGVGVAGSMLSNVIQQPTFSTFSRILSPAPLIFIAMACVSYLAHFSAPDFYHSFVGSKQASSTTISTEDNSVTARPIQRYKQMTIMGYTIVTLLNVCALTFGFLTFGGGCDGIILNNYNNIDIGAIASRLLVGVSVIGSYPFVMSSCRNSALEIWNTFSRAKTSRSPSASSPTTIIPLEKERRMTSILLAVVTSIALFAKDAGFVIGFNGAVMGSTIAFTFPALLFLKYHRSNPSKALSISKFDLWACRGLIGFGVVSSIVGGITTIISTFAPHLLSS